MDDRCFELGNGESRAMPLVRFCLVRPSHQLASEYPLVNANFERYFGRRRARRSLNPNTVPTWGAPSRVVRRAVPSCKPHSCFLRSVLRAEPNSRLLHAKADAATEQAPVAAVAVSSHGTRFVGAALPWRPNRARGLESRYHQACSCPVLHSYPQNTAAPGCLYTTAQGAPRRICQYRSTRSS